MCVYTCMYVDVCIYAFILYICMCMYVYIYIYMCTMVFDYIITICCRQHIEHVTSLQHTNLYANSLL